MHISTHHDRIWRSGCQEKEDNIRKQIQQCRPDAHVQLVDCLQIKTDKPIITDNYFLDGREAEYLFPEFWHIYHTNEVLDEEVIYHDFNCLMNRISGERLLLLYELYERGLLFDEVGIVSFNCLYHSFDPSIEQRQEFFQQVHDSLDMPGLDWICEKLKHKMPIMTEHDPDSAAMLSEITIVVESYNSDSVIAFSEKIFRALITPRPWVLFGSPGSVKLLRDSGFDVLDSCVNHSYDEIINQKDRMNAMLDTIYSFDPEHKAAKSAAEYNRNHLYKLGLGWEKKLAQICNP